VILKAKDLLPGIMIERPDKKPYLDVVIDVIPMPNNQRLIYTDKGQDITCHREFKFKAHARPLR
jgi:hypothetical protein